MRRLAVAVGVVAALLGYATLDVYDRVPGVLTLAPAPDPAPATPTPSTSLPPVALPSPPTAPAGMPLATSGAEAPLPTPAGVGAALAGVLGDARLGAAVSVAVRDAATGAHLLDVGADAPRTPASSLKLLTAVAVDATFPPGTRLTTQVVQGPAPDQVVLVAGGDTLLNPGPGDPAAVSGRAGLGDLVAATAASLRARGVTRVTVSPDLSHAPGPLVAPTWSSSFLPAGITGAVAAIGLSTQRATPGHPGPADPAAAVMSTFARALGAQGVVAVVGPPTVAAAGAPVLGSVTSAPVAEQLALALADSDNALTESLARQAAFARGAAPGFAETAAFVRSTVEGLGVDVTGVAIVDACGLSREDAVPARVLADVLALGAADSVPGMRETVRQLPVAGLSGTLSDRFAAAGSRGAAGVVRAKTGTLTGVSAVAGTLVTLDGRLLTFTVLASGIAPGAGTLAAREALDRFIATLADCGCRS